MVDLQEGATSAQEGGIVALALVAMVVVIEEEGGCSTLLCRSLGRVMDMYLQGIEFSEVCQKMKLWKERGMDAGSKSQ